jgi:O-antigen/teichoic acid export membrane protein
VSLIKQNILANVASRAGLAIASFLAVPVYVQLLGIEKYAIIGIYLLIQNLLQVSDLGIGTTVNRELARVQAESTHALKKRTIIKTYEIALVFLGFAAGGATIVSASWVASSWLGTQEDAQSELLSAVRLAGLSIILQLLVSFYNACLLGLEQQVRANTLLISATVARTAGAICVLWAVNTLIAFFLWQLAVGIVYALVLRQQLLRVVGGTREKVRVNPTIWITNYRFSLCAWGMSVLSIVVSQADKIFVGKMFSLETYGYYNLASTIASVPLMLGSAFSTALLPRINALISSNKTEECEILYIRAGTVLGAILFPITSILLLFPLELVTMLTGSRDIAQKTSMSACLLAIGSTALSLQMLPYTICLAKAKLKLNLWLSIVMSIISFPLMTVLGGIWGAVGVCLSWAIINISAGSILALYVHRYHITTHMRTWLTACVIRPMIFSFVPALALKIILEELHSPSAILCALATSVALSLLASGIATGTLQLLCRQKTPTPG